jgi:hypothetical protein
MAPVLPSTPKRDLWTRLTLGLVVLVVVLVSLPRLRGFALRENEQDAARLIARLGEQAQRRPLDDLAALLASRGALRRDLEDAELVADGRLLRRHGYLFALDRGLLGAAQLRAWPWKHGQTGSAAFLWSAERGLWIHSNRAGRFSGPAAAPPFDSPEGSGSGSGWRAGAAR